MIGPKTGQALHVLLHLSFVIAFTAAVHAMRGPKIGQALYAIFQLSFLIALTAAVHAEGAEGMCCYGSYGMYARTYVFSYTEASYLEVCKTQQNPPGRQHRLGCVLCYLYYLLCGLT